MKRTYKDLEKLHGVTRDQLNAIKAKGVNVWNDQECGEAVKSLRHKIKPGTELTNPETAAAQTLEQMERAIRTATNIDEVKILKEKVLALKGIVAVQQETRELVPRSEVREEIVRCVSAARAEIMKLTSDLPPRLAGLNESEIQRVLVGEIRNLLENLSSETGCLFSVDSP